MKKTLLTLTILSVCLFGETIRNGDSITFIDSSGEVKLEIVRNKMIKVPYSNSVKLLVSGENSTEVITLLQNYMNGTLGRNVEVMFSTQAEDIAITEVSEPLVKSKNFEKLTSKSKVWQNYLSY